MKKRDDAAARYQAGGIESRLAPVTCQMEPESTHHFLSQKAGLTLGGRFRFNSFREQ